MKYITTTGEVVEGEPKEIAIFLRDIKRLNTSPKVDKTKKRGKRGKYKKRRKPRNDNYDKGFLEFWLEQPQATDKFISKRLNLSLTTVKKKRAERKAKND